MQNQIYSFQDIQKLSLDTTDYYFSAKGLLTTKGWKIHLFLNRISDVKSPVSEIQTISEYLIKNNIEHKYGNGSDGSRTFTIYPGGGRDVAESLAQSLNKQFNGFFARLSPDGSTIDNDQTDYMFSPNIGIRFDGLKVKGYGWRGVPRFIPNPETYLIVKAVLKKDVSAEQESAIQLLAGHILLAKYCGANYLGKSYKNDNNDWDRFLFNDNIQGFSSDEINKVVNFFDANYANKIQDVIKSKNGIDINIGSKMPSVWNFGINKIKSETQNNETMTALQMAVEVKGIASKF